MGDFLSKIGFFKGLSRRKKTQISTRTTDPSSKIRSFPRFKLCEPCSRILIDFKGGGVGYPRSLQWYIWESSYIYTRTRREVESAATFGCVFCTSVMHQEFDGHYDEAGLKKFLSKGRRPRPPEPDDIIKLEIYAMSSDHSLSIRRIRSIGELPREIGTWGMWTTPNDPAAIRIPAEVVVKDLGSPGSFAEAREWMSDCFNTHEDCPQNLPADLPARLVQVSSLGEPLSARLREFHGQKGYYCALSYCWGGDQFHKTLSERYSQYKRELPYKNLPRTIIDAFEVTRSMGLKYIWIDSLCIIQDDDKDKQTHMANMMHIYQNTQFTISVTSGSSATQGFLEPNSDDASPIGFYHPFRVDEHTIGSVVMTAPNLSSFYLACCGLKPINTRAWTLQEVLFTPRLLFFNQIHMVWRCQKGYKPDSITPSDHSQARSEGKGECEIWAETCGYHFMPLKTFDGIPTPRAPGVGEAFTRSEGLYSAWHGILQNQTGRLLTVESDRLPAISAIAQVFASAFKSAYYAGLWGRFLVHDLMWLRISTSNDLDPKFPTYPSWSWVTVDRMTYSIPSSDSTQDDPVRFARAEIISCKISPLSGRNPFGEITGGELVIRGHLNKLQLIFWENQYMGDIRGQELWYTFHSDVKLERWKDDMGGDDCVAIWGLVLGDGPILRDFPPTKCIMMALIESRERHGCYERIGLVETTYHPPYWWEDCDTVTVTIV